MHALSLLIALACFGGSLSAQQVTGTVRDAQTNAALSGVRVSSGSNGTLSDAEGRFQLNLDEGAAAVQFSRVGYRPVEFDRAEVPTEVRMYPEPVMLGAITVEARGNTRLATGTSLSLAEVERDEIRSSGATSIAEALTGTAGVSVSRPGAWGAQAVVRGLSGERVAVMVDGMRMNNACYFGMDDGLATVDPSSVERVEILSGPGSTLYGSGSIGGVINVVTRQPVPGEEGVSGEVRAAASSAIPGGSLGGSLNLQRGRFDLAFSAEGVSYDDYVSPLGTVPGSSMKTGSSNLRLGFRPAPNHQLSFQTQFYEGRDIGWPTMAGHGAPGGHDDHGHDDHGHDDHGHDDHGHDGPPDHADPGDHHDAAHHEHEMWIPKESRRAFSAEYGWQLGRGILDAVTARAYVQSLDHQMTMEMAMLGEAPVTTLTEADSESRTTGARLQLRLHSHGGLHVDTGVEAVNLSAEATRWTEQHFLDGESVSETFRGWPSVQILDVGAFAQGELALGRGVTATGGARADYVKREADGWPRSTEWVGTGNVGFRADLPSNFGARFTLGFGYRIPDPTELFGLAVQPDGFIYRGNADLNTETSRNVEGSLTYDTDALAFELTAFQNDLYDMIAPTLADDSVAGRPVREYANIQSARLTGFTATAAVQLPANLMLSGTVSRTKGEDHSDGSPLPFIPPMEGGVSLRSNDAVLVDWVELQFRGAMRQDRNDPEVGEVPTSGYGVVNLHTGFDLAGTSFIAGIDNVLDKTYRHHLDPATLMRPGRNFYLKMTRAFGQ